MPRFDKIAIARAAIAAFTDTIKQVGDYHRAEVGMPAHWDYRNNDLRMVLTESVLRASTDASLSAILDIWKDGAGKVLSVSWEPERPWQPLHISSFKGALLQQVLDSVITPER